MADDSPPTEEKARFAVEVLDKLAALATAAFGLVAALAWNSAIQEWFRRVFGESGGLGAMFGYALLVTLFAVLATLWIGRTAGRLRKRLDRAEARERAL